MFTLSQAANVVYLRSASSQLTCLAGVICERNVREKEKTQAINKVSDYVAIMSDSLLFWQRDRILCDQSQSPPN